MGRCIFCSERTRSFYAHALFRFFGFLQSTAHLRMCRSRFLVHSLIGVVFADEAATYEERQPECGCQKGIQRQAGVSGLWQFGSRRLRDLYYRSFRYRQRITARYLKCFHYRDFIGLGSDDWHFRDDDDGVIVVIVVIPVLRLRSRLRCYRLFRFRYYWNYRGLRLFRFRCYWCRFRFFRLRLWFRLWFWSWLRSWLRCWLWFREVPLIKR